MKKRWLIPLILVMIAIVIALYFYTSSKQTQTLPTYFQYTPEETLTLSQLKSNLLMTVGSLKKWDRLMFDLIKTNKLGDAPASRIYAYVYTAQRDAAFLSYNVKQQFSGNLDAVSGEVLCLFFPNDCSRIQFQVKEDRYSSQLAKLVLNKIKTRIAEDNAQENLSPERLGKSYWQGVKPYFGQEVGSWKPWEITSVKQFLPPPPPNFADSFWQTELKQIKTSLEHITPNQTKSVVFWAGNPSTITPPGIWLKFANDYMETQQIAFSKVLFIRSILAMGIADTVIVIFHAKYTYWTKRPFMLDPSLHTVMPTPNHPSYPAGHAGISGVSATILTYYCPQNKTYWWNKAQEASSSRIWGGIHFPIDSQAGLILGERVGKAIIQTQPQLNMD